MNSAPQISAIICTHNPRAEFLHRVLQALTAQTLPASQWEILVVDSGSIPEIRLRSDLRLPPNVQLVRLDQPGLALARKAGALAARSPLLAAVDDDTVLAADYLATAVEFMARHPQVASCGGKFLPEFEIAPPDWLAEFHVLLAIRDLGPATIIVPGWKPGTKPTDFPPAAPIGVNVTRRTAYEDYRKRWDHDRRHAALGRSGKSLASGEDNDFSLCCLEGGSDLAYVPALQCRHLMPAARLDHRYLGRLARASSRTWVQVLALHGICPWSPVPAWTLPLRRFRSYLRQRAWSGPAAYIRWQGACGLFEGRASLTPTQP